MITLDNINNLFKDYTYGVVRPVEVPNSKNQMDCSGLVGWYLGEVYEMESMATNPFTWDIYEQLTYIGKNIYLGVTEELDISVLNNGDIIIFSNSKNFWSPNPNNYWAGIFWDKYHFLNFNTIENYGNDPITKYMTWFPSFTYVSVFRMRPIIERGSLPTPPPYDNNKKPQH